MNITQSAQNLSRLTKELDDLLKGQPKYKQKQTTFERKCGQSIVDDHSELIAEAFSRNPVCDFVLVRVIPKLDDLGVLLISLVAGAWTTEKMLETNFTLLQETGVKYFPHEDYMCKCTESAKKSNALPVVIRWEYSEAYIKTISQEDIIWQPLVYTTLVRRPYVPPIPVDKAIKATTKAKSERILEKQLEQELLNWIRSRGFDAENQVLTTKHRMDVWIPGKCFLELKKSRVNGDDICQAIDYCAEYKKPVIIVGTHIGNLASRGIEAFNKAVGADMLVFVQWSAVKTYLKGLFSEW